VSAEEKQTKTIPLGFFFSEKKKKKKTKQVKRETKTGAQRRRRTQKKEAYRQRMYEIQSSCSCCPATQHLTTGWNLRAETTEGVKLQPCKKREREVFGSCTAMLMCWIEDKHCVSVSEGCLIIDRPCFSTEWPKLDAGFFLSTRFIDVLPFLFSFSCSQSRERGKDLSCMWSWGTNRPVVLVTPHRQRSQEFVVNSGSWVI